MFAQKLVPSQRIENFSLALEETPLKAVLNLGEIKTNESVSAEAATRTDAEPPAESTSSSQED